MKVWITVKIIYDPEFKPMVDNEIPNYKTTKRVIDPIDEWI